MVLIGGCFGHFAGCLVIIFDVLCFIICYYWCFIIACLLRFVWFTGLFDLLVVWFVLFSCLDLLCWITWLVCGVVCLDLGWIRVVGALFVGLFV